MAYKFKNYKSVYRDPGSVFVNTTLRKRYDDNFTDHNLVQENLEQMAVTAEFEGDMQRAQQLRDQLNSHAKTRVDRGDFENMQGAVAADVNAFNKAYTPIKRNYEAREENKKEAQQMVMSGNRSGEWYEKWLNRSLLTTGENGDYTPYRGLSDLEDGSVNPASYYQRQAVSADKKPAEEVLNAVKAMIVHRHGGKVTQEKEPRWVDGVGFVEYVVTKKGGVTEYITTESVKQMVEDIITNREDLQSFMRDKADLNTFDLSSQELDQNLALRSAKLQDDLDNGQMSNKNKITSEERAKIEARIQEIDDAVASDDMALKRKATRGADYENQYDAIMDMAVQARAHSSTVGGGETSQVDELWLAKYKADQEAALNTQFNLGTPGGSGQDVIGNDLFADAEGNLTAESLAAAAESGDTMRNANTSNFFPNGDGVSVYPILTDLVVNTGRSSNVGDAFSTAIPPGSGTSTQAEVNAALVGLSDDAIRRIVADASNYQDAFVNTSTTNSLKEENAVGLLQEMRNSLEFSNNIALNSQRFLNIATSNSDLSPSTFPSKVREFLPPTPEDGFGSSEEITSHLQPALNTMMLGMYNGIDENSGVFTPAEMDNPNDDHPAVGNMMEFLAPLLNTYDIPGEMRAELINNSLEAVRNMHETQGSDPSIFDDYGGLLGLDQTEDTSHINQSSRLSSEGFSPSPKPSAGVSLDLVRGVNDVIENGQQQVQDFIDNANVSHVYLPESTNAPMDVSKNFALSTSFKKQLGLRSMDFLRNIPTAATAHTEHPVDMLSATSLSEGAPYTGSSADGTAELINTEDVNLTNYEIIGEKTLFSKEITGRSMINTIIIKAKKIDKTITAGPTTFSVELPYDKVVMHDAFTTGGNFKDLQNVHSLGMKLRDEIILLASKMSTISTTGEGMVYEFERKPNVNGKGVKLKIQVKSALGGKRADGMQALRLDDNTLIILSGTGIGPDPINNVEMPLRDLVRYINAAGL